MRTKKNKILYTMDRELRRFRRAAVRLAAEEQEVVTASFDQVDKNYKDLIKILQAQCYGYVPIPYVPNTVNSRNSLNARVITSYRLQYKDSHTITIGVVTSTYVLIVLYVHTYINMYIGTIGYVHTFMYVVLNTLLFI